MPSCPAIRAGQSVLVERYPLGDVNKTMPVDNALLKQHLQLTHNSDDALIDGTWGYIAAATEEIERRGQVSLISQSRQLLLDEYPVFNRYNAPVIIPWAPVVSVDSVSYLDGDGAAQTLAATEYAVQLSGPRPTLYFNGTQPTIAEVPGAIQVNYTAGYGDNYAAVPPAWQNCVMVLAYHLYERREGFIGFNQDKAFERMLSSKVLAAGARKTY